MTDSLFGKCSLCRAPIAHDQPYFRCSVSTCNLGELKLMFCSRECWEEHVPTARHRTARCIEERAPEKK